MYEKSIEIFSLISFIFLSCILHLYDRLFTLTLFCATLNQVDKVKHTSVSNTVLLIDVGMWKLKVWELRNIKIKFIIIIIIIINLCALTYKLQIFKCWNFTSFLLPLFLRLPSVWGNLETSPVSSNSLTSSPFNTLQTSVFSWCFSITWWNHPFL